MCPTCPRPRPSSSLGPLLNRRRLLNHRPKAPKRPKVGPRPTLVRASNLPAWVFGSWTDHRRAGLYRPRFCPGHCHHRLRRQLRRGSGCTPRIHSVVSRDRADLRGLDDRCERSDPGKDGDSNQGDPGRQRRVARVEQLLQPLDPSRLLWCSRGVYSSRWTRITADLSLLALGQEPTGLARHGSKDTCGQGLTEAPTNQTPHMPVPYCGTSSYSRLSYVCAVN